MPAMPASAAKRHALYLVILREDARSCIPISGAAERVECPGERREEGRVPEKDRSQAAERLTEAFGEPYQEVVRSAVDAQQRNVQLAQGWVESVTGVIESLDAYKDVIERNTALQEKSTDLVQGFFGDMTTELRQGMQSSQDVARILMEGSEKQMEAFQAMLSEAMNSYTNLMNAPFDLYRKNLEALGKQGK